MVLDTGLQTEVISAYDHFHVLERKAGKTGKEWRDSPFQEFLDVSDRSRGICLMTRGLPAYEGVVSEKGLKLYLPLLRAVGSIGPAAGANHPVPEAQCPGVHRFEYALMPHKGDWREGDCIRSAMNYRNPMIVEADTQHSGEYPSSAALYTIESDDTHPVITCLKQAESEEGAVLRLWNPGGDQKVHIHSMKAVDQAYMTSLDETKAKKVNPARDGIQLSPNGLTTLIFRHGTIKESSGWTKIFIYPGYEFKIVNTLITNFHLPESTLIMLVSALANKESVLNAYDTAVKEKYRFFSFGDAMVIK